MARTVILSEETVSALLEAHASLAAWYYELVRALQAKGPPSMPDEATRKAFLARLAQDFPEIAAVAKKIEAPRTYVPPPPAFAAPPPPTAVPSPSPSSPSSPSIEAPPAAAAPPAAPAPAPAATSATAPADGAPAIASAAAPMAPPPLVVPGTVKYE